MMNIVLVNPPWVETYGEFKESAKTSVFYPPLGLCYLSSLMKQEGHAVKLIDCDVEGKDEEGIIKDILSFSPDLIGITAATTVFHNAKRLAQTLKQHTDVPIVLGGPHVTLTLNNAMLEACRELGRQLANAIPRTATKWVQLKSLQDDEV